MGTTRAFTLVNPMADPAIQSLSNCTLRYNSCCSIIIIQPILLYSPACFSKLLSDTNWVKLTYITNTTAKLISLPIANLAELKNKSNNRSQHISHPLNRKINPLPSGCRYRTSRFGRTLLANTLIPADIIALNSRTCKTVRLIPLLCHVRVYCSVLCV